MIVVLKKSVTPKQIGHLTKEIRKLGLKPFVKHGVEKTVIGIVGDERILAKHPLDALPDVEEVIPILKPYKLISREFKQENTVVKIGSRKNAVEIGGSRIVVIAGPCAVENREQLLHTARAVAKAGAHALRGGAFKPRTSPYAFQGLGEEGLKLLAEAGEETGLPVVTEAMDASQVDLVVEYADAIQIGARNMQNYPLLKKAGQASKPVLLKRGLASTIEELLLAAEYVASEGNPDIMLCERGIRTFEPATRFTLDVSAVPVIKKLSYLPVIVDPTHSGGKRELVAPLSKAAIAAGADGLIVEVHPNPEHALSDSAQQLKPREFTKLMEELAAVARAVGRSL